MEPTIIEGSEVAIERSHIGMAQIRITQPDDDIIVLLDRDVEEFIAAVREHTTIVEEEDTTPEKWYVVLKNSNHRLTNGPGAPMTFTTYADARIYARNFGGLERTYCPISAGEYKRAFKNPANVVEEAEPSAYITAEGEDLRMTRIVARVKIQQLRRDAAYEEGRISAIDSILED